MAPKDKSHKPVTQADVAAIVGCSQNTVALALRGSTRISAKRRQAVQRAATQLGYRPNIAARSLRSGRSGIVGIFTGNIDDARSYYLRRMFYQLHSQARCPMLGCDERGTVPWYNAPWLDTFLAMSIDAVVSFAWHDDEPGKSELDYLPPWHPHPPVIFSGFQPRASLPCDFISMDRHRGAAMGVDYLRSKGHTRIVMLERNWGWYVTEGYRDAMTRAGLKPEIFERESGENVRAYLDRFIRWSRAQQPAVTATYVLSGPLAADLIIAALAAGLSIPRDLAVVGHDYMPYSDRLAMPLTTVEQPLDALVDATIETLNMRLDQPEADPVYKDIPFQLHERATT